MSERQSRDHAREIWEHHLDWARHIRGDVQVIRRDDPVSPPAAEPQPTDIQDDDRLVAIDYSTRIEQLAQRFQEQIAQLVEQFSSGQIDADQYACRAEEYSADYERQVALLTS